MRRLMLAFTIVCMSITTHAAPPDKGKRKPLQQYSISQAISDNAQLHTIAFSGLAFLTGNFAYDTFLPPGKVSDYFGFQYMRDIDAGSKGHNTSFLTTIANNTLKILSTSQKAQLITLAKAQQDGIKRFAMMRLPMIKAFRLNLQGELPQESQGLNRDAVMQYSSELYQLDAELAYQRAQVMGNILHSLTSKQKAQLNKLEFANSKSWPSVKDQVNKRSLPHDVHVAVMTYASEMFAWYAGSLEADTYFCPERHGMYFGGFGMKTAPAMGKKDYSISTSLTGDSGRDFLTLLNKKQRQEITSIVDKQRPLLDEIVTVRRQIASELRHLQKGKSADKKKVVNLSKRYGELDGQLSYLYADAYAKVYQSLTSRQKSEIAKLRTDDSSASKGPFLYSEPVSNLKVGDTRGFF